MNLPMVLLFFLKNQIVRKIMRKLGAVLWKNSKTIFCFYLYYTIEIPNLQLYL